METLKTYKPSNSLRTLKAEEAFSSLGKNKDVYVVVNGKTYILDCVVEFKDFIDVVGGREVEFDAVPTV